MLVGATSSSFHVRVYNSLYPDEVAGAGLIETTDTDVFAHSPAYMKGSLASLPPFLKAFSCKVLGPAMLDTGLLRLMGNPGSGQPFGSKNLTPDQQTELSFLSKNPETVRGGEGSIWRRIWPRCARQEVLATDRWLCWPPHSHSRRAR